VRPMKTLKTSFIFSETAEIHPFPLYQEVRNTPELHACIGDKCVYFFFFFGGCWGGYFYTIVMGLGQSDTWIMVCK
jgi:hypothetical protein